jgi:hypothetical protein
MPTMLSQQWIGDCSGGELGKYLIVVGSGIFVAVYLPLKLLGKLVHG